MTSDTSPTTPLRAHQLVHFVVEDVEDLDDGEMPSLIVRLSRPLTSYEQDAVKRISDVGMYEGDSSLLALNLDMRDVLTSPHLVNRQLDHIRSLGAAAQDEMEQRLAELNSLNDLINKRL